MRFFATPAGPDPMNRVTTNGFGECLRARARSVQNVSYDAKRRNELLDELGESPLTYSPKGQSQSKVGASFETRFSTIS